MSTTTYRFDHHGRAFIDKDPDADLDYTFDMTDWLAEVGDSIASVAITTDAPLTQHDESFVGGYVTSWFAGGIAGNTLIGKMTLTTNSVPPRVESRRIHFKILER